LRIVMLESTRPSRAELVMSNEFAQTRLRRFPIVDTRSRDELRDVLVNRYGATGFNLGGKAKPFQGVANYFPTKNLDLSYGAVSANLRITFPGTEFVRQQFLIGGSSRLVIGGSESHIGPTRSGIVPAEADFSCDFAQHSSQLFLRISTAGLRSKLSAMLGRPVGRNLDFTSGLSPETPEQLQLRRVLDFFVSELDRDGSTLSEFQKVEFEQLLMVSFLKANRHNFSHLLAADNPPLAAPSQVRAVEEYIEANWHRPIMVEEMAQQVGIAARTLFDSFKRARGYTPISFHQRIRLEQARRMLQQPGEITSVLAVGLTCGFRNAGHFARYYRQAFNELPSITLALARGKRNT
jgi:AraC-like DNA-binding protein